MPPVRKAKQGTALRDRLADDIRDVTEAVTARFRGPRTRKMRALVRSIQAGKAVEVDADTLAWSLGHIGEENSSARVARRGDQWRVAPDGTYAPV